MSRKKAHRLERPTVRGNSKKRAGRKAANKQGVKS